MALFHPEGDGLSCCFCWEREGWCWGRGRAGRPCARLAASAGFGVAGAGGWAGTVTATAKRGHLPS